MARQLPAASVTASPGRRRRYAGEPDTNQHHRKHRGDGTSTASSTRAKSNPGAYPSSRDESSPEFVEANLHEIQNVRRSPPQRKQKENHAMHRRSRTRRFNRRWLRRRAEMAGRGGGHGGDAIAERRERLAVMANTFPKRTLRKVEGWLGDYDGPITALLCGMLKELHCDPRIPVIKYTYYDGEILAKCRVSVQLPEKLLMSRIMPYGEAKTITTAYHMGLFKAILEIRQHKSVELLCSEFSHIPHAEEDEDPTLNHLVLAHRSPEAAAQHMDSCKSLLTTMYLLHMKMRGEIDHMLAEFTDPDKVQTRMRDLRAQPQHTTPFFSLDSYVDLSDQLSHKDPLTPNFVPHYPHVSASYESGYGGDDSRNLNCSESPIENSTGWRFGEPFGDEGEPITCESEDEGGAVNQNVNQSFGHEEKDTNSISLDLEMGLPKTSQYVVGLGEMALVETEEARREREAREKEEADAAARAENAPPPPHPMMHPDFQQYMRSMEEDRRRYQESQSKNMQDFFTHVINDRGNEGKGVTLSDFQNARPLPFTSAPEPMDAEDWLMDTERKLKTVGCNDEEKIRYTTYLLSGPAASWWENLVAVHPDKVFTWEEFKKKFRDAHVPMGWWS
ncbi:hypothetical protein QYE76_047043 [Lolium multiflorum]|uniref:Retrotransposon gag domain-containing protein n=1 Tax=Lolium multiflorum TaxID=4521 RepID=A0AAD8TN45_LOLMU|nr:hypothetical protein QYE76_047043 [Lolium multiflorum]